MLLSIGILVGMFIALAVIFIPTLPFLAKHFANDPEKPDQYYVTTKVEPNQAKFVMVGGKVKKLLMNLPGFKTRGGPIGPDAFDILPLVQGEESEEKNLPFLEWVIYRFSGYRYVGIFFGKLFTYNFPRTKEKMKLDGTLDPVGVIDVSDHFVLTEQTHPFIIPDVETGEGENVKVEMDGKFTVQIVNPYKTAFVAKEQWLLQVIAAMRVKGKNFARLQNFETLLDNKASMENLKNTLSTTLQSINKEIEGDLGSEALWGVRILRVLVENITMTDPEAEKSRTAKFNADRQAEVTAIGARAEAGKITTVREAQAKAEAGYTKTVAEELKRQGAFGVMLSQQQTQIKMAEKAGTLIMNSGGGDSIDPIQASILEELKKQNRGGGAQSTSSEQTSRQEKPRKGGR